MTLAGVKEELKKLFSMLYELLELKLSWSSNGRFSLEDDDEGVVSSNGSWVDFDDVEGAKTGGGVDS